MHSRTSFSYLRKPAFICGCFIFLLCTAAPVLAQHGGKAEPGRIEFKRGASSTTISGVVRGDEQAEYVLGAKKGQRLIITLTSQPSRFLVVFQLLGPDNNPLELKRDAKDNNSVVLPNTGDYFINVKRPTEARGTSRYKLTITVR